MPQRSLASTHPQPSVPRPTRASFASQIQIISSKRKSLAEAQLSLEEQTSPSHGESATDRPDQSALPGALHGTTSRKAGPKFRRRDAAEGVEPDSGDGDVRNGRSRSGGVHKRGESPKDSELIEIVTSTCTMRDLIRDAPRGKKSGRYEDIKAIDWKALRKQNRDREEEIQRQRESRRGGGNHLDALAAASTTREQRGVAGPRMKNVNGQIVVDQDSLQVDRHAAADEIEEILEEIEESDLTNIVNSATFGKRNPRGQWTSALTEQFYFGLRSFGTDFEIISRMIPGVTRRQVKLKFDKEEKLHADRVNAALLGKRTSISLNEFAERSGMKAEELGDPEAIQAELDEIVLQLKREADAEKEAERVELERRKAAALASYATHGRIPAEAEQAQSSTDGPGLPNTRSRTRALSENSGSANRQPSKPSVKPKSRKGKGRKDRADVAEVLGTVDEIPPAPLPRVHRC